MRRLMLLAAVALAAVSCDQAQGPSGLGGPTMEEPILAISDGMHEGNEHFFFLPPMVPDPTYSGTFDPTLSPVVRITEGANEVVVLSPVLNADDEQYHANWHTDLYDLDPALTYRITVEVDGDEIGYADVDVVSSGRELKDVETGEYIPLKDGRTLPIKFRIEEGYGSCTGTVVFADDFDDGTFQGVWTEDNASWLEASGVLTAGSSCQGGTYCPEGRALLRSPAFPVGDGTFTLEFDTFHDIGGAAAGFSDLAISLHGPGAVSCSGGSCSGWDRILYYQQNAFSTGAYRIGHNIDRGGITYEWLQHLILGEWHRVRVQYRGANGYSIVVTRLSNGAIVLSQSDESAHMTVPADVTNLYVQVSADGQGKAIDNLRVIRDCQ